ncbi:MAG: hypothetical protein FJZ49_08155 [Candidatus Verstraetearchaeota archaeon]|nr:hypothetical protein [Candidatus Verstraetearchaeota archaeon]
MYDRNLTEASRSALVELCSALNAYRGDFVLAGGWAPYFLTRDYFDHCGSKDIDLVLRPSIMVKYESIRKTVERLGYQETPNPFRFEKKVVSPLDEKEYRIGVDFLTEPKVARKVFPLVKVQEDLTACLIEGSSIVFKFYYEAKIEGTLPDNGKIVATINVADIVGALTMKGLALPRLIDKDSYDVYAISGFYDGSPDKASESYVNRVKKAKLTAREKGIIQSSMSRINQTFKLMDSYGAFAVSRFVGANINSDVYLRVSAFLKNVSSVL